MSQSNEVIAQPNGWVSRFVAHVITVAISGAVAWGTSVYFESKKTGIAQNRYILELEKDKVEIINLVKDQETTLALALIDYYQLKFGNEDYAYATLLGSISAYIDTAQGQISNKKVEPSTHAYSTKFIESISPELVRNQFFSSNRREYAEQLVDLYVNAKIESRKKLVSVLLEAIIAKEKDGGRRYRINIYIALTFSLLPKTTMSENELKLLTNLKEYSEYKADQTFKLNVDNAIANQT